MSQLMDTTDVAEFLRFIDRATGQPDRRAAREYLDREGVRPIKRGRVSLYKREDVEGTLRIVERTHA